MMFCFDSEVDHQILMKWRLLTNIFIWRGNHRGQSGKVLRDRRRNEKSVRRMIIRFPSSGSNNRNTAFATISLGCSEWKRRGMLRC